ncbi:NmrA family transcriptional regulator [Actinobacteria bacterium YIM 96077]|uniref:NmrA family transcriptional regulator n=1 Tax=Phytoactinopolyspora halophila TaxID=1981511 RepID=A0A329QID8_9ACTN|nr:NmrA family NAD(P)-binding protein [Phytoactinopolyspora halophila]AYY13080.1 NmrA family transcriptional regulator [Actinobacteria bacterium YIM 96077]RAW11092.1 NmrA family transcriptional regulator [Phytoactinopolyspora halophila]
MTSTDHHRYLVVGATGEQGGAVARRLLSDGHHVRVLIRAGTDPVRLPAGVEPVIGDLADPTQMASAFAGVTHASVMLPMVYEPTVVASYAEHLARAAAAAGVNRLVFNTGTGVPDVLTGVTAFETRRAAAATLLGSGVPTVVLHPLVYRENLCAPWVAGSTVHEGVLRYPLPADLPVAWLGHDDLAAATVAALTRDGVEGTTVRLGGPDVVTGTELAGQIGAALGRPVEYAELDVDDFERGLAYAVGADAAAGVAATYRWLATAEGARSCARWAVAASSRHVEEALGVQLTPLRTWAGAQPWHRIAQAAA